ncbi:MAG: Rrf2 family transcriptional regulator [bacterium]|nr:Rrf2 family transcriptional regulator [bacterium]
MRFSKTTDYALRVMVALASVSDTRLSLQYLSTREKIPRKFLEHVVRSLKEADLVLSTPGPKGGYQLARPANLIPVGEILQAVQGPLIPMDRLGSANLPHHLHDPLTRLRNVVGDIRAFARQKLDSFSLADLAEVKEIPNAHESLMYYI